MSAPKAVIRKYGDRRLYDSTGSRYVKLEDIARMIREGVDVQVLDAGSGKDITRVILTQIVVEDARQRESGLPLKLLRQLVVVSDRATHEFFSSYLDHAMDIYGKAQEAIQTGLSDARRAVTSPIEFARGLLAGSAKPSTGEPEIDQLRRLVEELRAEIADLKAEKKPRARKVSSAGSRRKHAG